MTAATARIVVDEQRCEVRVDGRRVILSPLQFRVLACLARHRNEVCSAVTIAREAWGTAMAAGLVKWHLIRIRRALGDAASCLQTRRGFGWILVQEQGNDHGK